MKAINAKSVCKGIAIGKPFYYQKAVVNIPDIPAADTKAERVVLEEALTRADQRLETLYNRALETIGEEEAKIFDMHRLMLSDEDFLDVLRARVGEGKNALRAVSEGGSEFAAFFDICWLTTLITKASKWSVCISRRSIPISSIASPNFLSRFFR